MHRNVAIAIALVTALTLVAGPVLADPVPAGVCNGVTYLDDSSAQFRLFVLGGEDLPHVTEFMELLSDNCIEPLAPSLPVTTVISQAAGKCGVLTGKLIPSCTPGSAAAETLALWLRSKKGRGG